MKVAVTGSSGFVGSHLVKRLKGNGFSVIQLDIGNGIDLTDWKQIRSIEKFDLIFHLAAKVFVPDSYQDPRDFYYTNITSTINALELCRIHKAKIIFASSYIYGTPEYLPIDEEHPIDSFNPYSETKIIGEQLCKRYHKDFEVSVIIVRPFNIYGPGQNEKFLIPTIIKQAKKGSILLKDPEPKRDMVYIDDVIDAYVKMITFNKTSFEIFNLGAGASYSVKLIAEIIANNCEQNIDIKFTGEKRKNEIMDTVADITKANKLLNWKPDISLKNGLAVCVSEYGEKEDSERR